jgi:NTE family protein
MAKKALVISGGGSKGAFAVGAVNYLVSELNMDFDIIAGTSTGSLISPMVAANQITQLVATYTSVTTSDILIKLPLVQAFTSGTSIFDVSPLERVIEQIMSDSIASRVLNSRKQMFIAAGCLQTRKLAYFQTGPQGKSHDNIPIFQINSAEMLRKAMLASSDQPTLMPPVEVIPGEIPIRQYVDGGVRAIAPTEIAIVNGAEELYTIILDPADYSPDNSSYDSILKILLRTIDLFTAQVTHDNIHTARVTNNAIVYLDALKNKVKNQFNLNDNQIKDLFTNNLPVNPVEETPLSRLYIIRPDEELPTDGLEFNPALMAHMMELGRAKAKKIVDAIPESREPVIA